MITTIVNIFIISAILVFIIDLSGFIEEMEKKLGKWLNCKARIPKPFSCSLCSTFWCGLIYLVLTHNLTFTMVGIVCLMAYLTPCTYEVLLTIKHAISFIFNKIDKLFW